MGVPGEPSLCSGTDSGRDCGRLHCLQAAVVRSRVGASQGVFAKRCPACIAVTPTPAITWLAEFESPRLHQTKKAGSFEPAFLSYPSTRSVGYLDRANWKPI